MNDKPHGSEQSENAASVNRRRMLKLGMAAAPAIVTLKASPVSAATSIYCSVPMVARTRDGSPVVRNFDAEGKFTTAGLDQPGVVGPPTSTVPNPTGMGGPVPGYTADQVINRRSNGMPQQHIRYIEEQMSGGDWGFTCFASIMGRGI